MIPAQKVLTIMESQNPTIRLTKDFPKNVDPSALENKKDVISPLIFDLKDGDDLWNSDFPDPRTYDSRNGINDSLAENDLHNSKNVMKSELPDTIVSNKEKGVCPDDGILHKKDKVSHQRYKKDNSHCDSYEGGSEVELFISDDLEVLESSEGGFEDESTFDEDIAKHGDSKEVTEPNTSDKDSFVDKALPIEEFGTRSFLRSFLTSLDCEENNVSQSPDEVNAGENITESLAATEPSTEPEPKENVKASSNLLYESKVESQRITFNFKSPTHSSTTGDLKERYVDYGESSFSARDGVTYSGPIPYSGSLSLRSNESTTSGKSFAFPVLQPECNSSPERMKMTKEDRKNFRKHKGWRPGLFCCRF